jgi:ATP-dependent Clp protease adapter protein ClpS
MEPMRKYIDIITEADILDKERVTQKQEVPLHAPGGAGGRIGGKQGVAAAAPGGATVVVFNDNITPYEVAVEAIASATGLSEAEAASRMMKAHTQGWAPVAAYANKDVAESVADKIMRHAQQNTGYDHYRSHPQLKNFRGPWPLHAEVLDAQQ